MKKEQIRKFSAGGVIEDNGKYLVIRWLSEKTVELPKGTIEAGETPEQACVREVMEETGYLTTIVAPLLEHTFTFDWKDGKTYKKTVYYYLLKRVSSEEPSPDRMANEDFENVWMSGEEAYKALSFDHMKQALRKAAEIRQNNPSLR